MKIAYVTTFDSNDPSAWSSAGYEIPRVLEAAGAEIVRIGNLRRTPTAAALARMAIAKATGHPYQIDRERSVLRGYAEQVIATLHGRKFDVLLSPGSIPLAFIQSDKPKVLWTDCTFASMLDYYPAFTGLPRRNIRDGHAMEKASLSGCDLAVFNCEWGARAAIDVYGTDPSKVQVVPFGSSLETALSLNNLRELVEQRLSDNTVRLLFVGTDWGRKNGDFAVAVAERLNQRGVKATLSIVGTTRPKMPEHVASHGLINKGTSEGAEFLSRCYMQSTFLIHPALAECNANVFSEACAFGLPVLANNTGGNATSVISGGNGHLFALDDGPEEWASWIIKMSSDREAYYALSYGALLQHSELLNWSVAAPRMLRLIESVMRRSSSNDSGSTSHMRVGRLVEPPVRRLSGLS
jgi:glycosyltransferase involved in cell wall biosynthesis